MEKTFSGNKVVLGAAAFLFCSLGYLSCYQSGMALFPEAYNMDMAMVSTAIMPTALVAFLTSLYAPLECQCDAILITGGLAHSDYIVGEITKYVGGIAPVIAYPGEDELGALAQGALRVMRGEEELQVYA